MFHNRAIWRDMDDALRNHDGGVFLAHYTDLYVAGQVMAVRRITEPEADGSTVSLGRLLKNIGRNPSVMNRDRHVALYTRGRDDVEPHWIHRGRSGFDEYFGDNDGQFSLAKNQDGVRRLTERSEAIRSYANRTIAHIDSRELEETPTYGELDQAIDEVGELLRDVTLLFEAAWLLDPEPIIQDDWKWPFRQALF